MRLIRKLERKDFDKCAKLIETAYTDAPYNESFIKGSALNYLKSKFKQCKNNCFVLVINNEIIGFILSSLSYWSNGPQAVMEELVVDKKHQGKGNGKQLVAHLEEKLRREGIKSIMLWTKRTAPAHAFHQKNGYADANDLTVMFKSL
ncbi:MAG: GNAT family N-acetyltransferase [Candidatus Nanoarchaeia archaeon]|jgi:GNAT superfamily N-acetyltransferase